MQINTQENHNPLKIAKIEQINQLIQETNLIIYNEEEPENIINILRYFHNNNFRILIDIFAVDYPTRLKRIELIYLLLNIKSNKRAQIKINVDPFNETVLSATGVFKAANWFEREVYDMNGVKFENHPNLTRILTDYNFEGHPLLKDFPLSGYKEVRYNLESKEVEYEEVNLPQEYRTFDFLTPWEGTKYVDEIIKKKD